MSCHLLSTPPALHCLFHDACMDDNNVKHNSNGDKAGTGHTGLKSDPGERWLASVHRMVLQIANFPWETHKVAAQVHSLLFLIAVRHSVDVALRLWLSSESGLSCYQQQRQI